MRLAHRPELGHLTYCTNIHPGETWPEVAASLERHLPEVKRRVAADQPFGVGLRLSAIAAAALREPAALEQLKALLATSGCYVFTINGFPYGPFHGRPVKEQVYQPDWRQEARVAYSNQLADLLAELLPDDPALEGSVSTVPGTFKPLAEAPGAIAEMARNLVRHAAHLVGIRERTGRTIALALEPEPCCFLETIDETVAFFEQHLLGAAAVRQLIELTGLARGDAEAALRRHLGVCYDVCHAAVEFEDPAGSLRALRAAGIGVPKLQLSAALRIAEVGAGDRRAAPPFDEPVYLHQVIERRGGPAPAPSRSAAGARHPRRGARRRVAGALPRADLPPGAEGLLDHPGVPRRDPGVAPARADLGAPRGRDLHLGRPAGALSPGRRRERDRARAHLGDRAAWRMSWAVALRLGRVSNLPTVWTNTLAGIVLAGGNAGDRRTVPLIVALSLFYVAGMYLNDAYDAEIDARERPERPIPSGQVSAETVFAAGFGMMVLGLALLGWVGYGARGGTGIGPVFGGLGLGRGDRAVQPAPQGQPAEPGADGHLPHAGLRHGRARGRARAAGAGADRRAPSALLSDRADLRGQAGDARRGPQPVAAPVPRRAGGLRPRQGARTARPPRFCLWPSSSGSGSRSGSCGAGNRGTCRAPS